MKVKKVRKELHTVFSSQLLICPTKNIADRLSEIKVSLSAKAGKEGKLFGSITSKDIAEALEKQFNIKVDKRKIDLPDGIKTCGIREVKVTLYPKVVGTFKVEVTELK